MAALAVYCFMLAFVIVLPEIQATTVEVTAPIHPVTVGGILAVECQVTNPETGQIVTIFRATRQHTEEVWSGSSYLQSALKQRVFVSERFITGGTTIYFMTITHVTLQDQGRYMCRVGHYENFGYVQLADDSTNIDVYQLPDRFYPQCKSTPDNIKNLDENEDLRLTCISSKGIPTVRLRWINSKNLDIVSVDRDQDDTVSSEINVWTSRVHDGSVFICEMASSGFQDFKRTCQIGPITLRRNKDTENVVAILPPIKPTEKIDQHTNQNVLPISDECDNECPSDDTFTILYLSVATIGATILCIVFLTTTIVWCCKYNRASAEIKRAQRNMTGGDGSEPVYVSLQSRPGNEPNSMLMTVDDPNNPGDKVTMPKEVFDEFYRSLTLKKRISCDENVHV